MRILLINDYASLDGGAEIALFALRDGLRARGHDARLFATTAGLNGAGSHADYRCFGTKSSFRTLVQSANPAAYWALKRTLEKFKPDVIHVSLFLTQLSPLILPLLQQYPALYYAVWYRAICPTGTKCLPDGSECEHRAGVICLQSGCISWRDAPPIMLQFALWRRWQGAFRTVVANSLWVADRLEAEGLGAVSVIPHGVPIREARPKLQSPPTVLFVGRLVQVKGVDVLLRAFALVLKHIPDARLLIAGDGPERTSLKELARNLEIGEALVFLGHVPHAAVDRLLDATWVQSVPSRWAEPFGIVAAEAMMAGVAVIASRSGGLTEIVRDADTGFLTTPGEVAPLANALARLLGDRELAERMGGSARQRALAEFGEPLYIERFVAQYEQMFAGSENGKS
jgi:glycosyltransferase involved in cell wall biosynthesis